MSEKDYKDYFIEFARQLGELNGNINAVLDRLEKGDEKLAEHEARLAELELNKKQTSHKHGEDAIPKWVIYTIIALISALCGVLGVKLPSFM